jgi:excisionase family DNA binding protein
MTNHSVADTEPDDAADLLTIDQAAHFLCISKRSFFRLLADGEPIPSVMLRGRRLFRRETLQDYINASER